MQVVKSDEGGLDAAAGILLAGGVAVIPTDTVYGLAAHPSFPEAVERLYSIKGREAKKPIALLAADAESVERFGYAVPGEARSLLGFWPGALTLVLPRSSAEGFRLRASDPMPPSLGPSEGFRVPAHDWTRSLLARCGGLLRVTSANLSGRRAATDAPAALAEVGLSADIVVDDGISPGGVPSTVVRVLPSGGTEVLRRGAVCCAIPP